MKKPLKFLLILAILSGCYGHAADAVAPEGPAGAVFEYKKSGGKARAMEIFFPPGHDRTKSKVPGLLLFHGGSWAGGDLKQFREACRYFAGRGLVAATADYQMLSAAENARLPEGETRKRVCITDAKSAIRWIKQHAGELGIDPARIISGGGSAGGHVAMLATLNPGLDDPGDPKGFDTSVVAYLLFNPAFTAADGKDPQVDVLRYLNPETAPAIVFFGSKDSWKAGWDTVYQKMAVGGGPLPEVLLAEGQSHGFFNSRPWLELTLAESDRFLVRQGWLTGNPGVFVPPASEKLAKAP